MRRLYCIYFVALGLLAAGPAMAQELRAIEPQSAEQQGAQQTGQQMVPDIALEQDYRACMGVESAEANPERGAYCQCIREKLSHWNEATYAAAAQQQSQLQGRGSQEQVSEQIAGIAKSCLAQVLR